jgi:hypothetical protein
METLTAVSMSQILDSIVGAVDPDDEVYTQLAVAASLTAIIATGGAAIAIRIVQAGISVINILSSMEQAKESCTPCPQTSPSSPQVLPTAPPIVPPPPPIVPSPPPLAPFTPPSICPEERQCRFGSCPEPPDRCCSDGTSSIPGTGGECACGIPGGTYCIGGKTCCKDALGLGNCCSPSEFCSNGVCSTTEKPMAPTLTPALAPTRMPVPVPTFICPDNTSTCGTGNCCDTSQVSRIVMDEKIDHFLQLATNNLNLLAMLW